MLTVETQKYIDLKVNAFELYQIIEALNARKAYFESSMQNAKTQAKVETCKKLADNRADLVDTLLSQIDLIDSMTGLKEVLRVGPTLN